MTYRDGVNIKCCHTSRSVGQSPSTKKDFEEEAVDSKKDGLHLPLLTKM